MKSTLRVLPLVLSGLFLAGCAHYVVPGKPAELSAMAPPEVREGFLVEPTQPFPASVAVVRVQGPAYTNYHLRQHGGVHAGGNYTVVLAREFESAADDEKLRRLPGIADLISLNRLLLPAAVNGAEDLRLAASRLQADLVFLYTVETVFFDQDASKPLSVITLGLSPTRRITASTTASALLLDTRSGYIYGAFEATARETKVSTSWGSRDSADRARLETEGAAFRQMLDAVAEAWPRLYARYGPADGRS